MIFLVNQQCQKWYSKINKKIKIILLIIILVVKEWDLVNNKSIPIKAKENTVTYRCLNLIKDSKIKWATTT